MGDVTEEVLTQLSLRRSKRVLAKGLRSGEIIPENFSLLWDKSPLLLSLASSNTDIHSSNPSSDTASVMNFSHSS